MLAHTYHTPFIPPAEVGAEVGAIPPSSPLHPPCVRTPLIPRGFGTPLSAGAAPDPKGSGGPDRCRRVTWWATVW